MAIIQMLEKQMGPESFRNVRVLYPLLSGLHHFEVFILMVALWLDDGY